MIGRRVVLVGSYGAGKTTLAARLGELLDLEVFHLDALRWLPGWRLRPKPEWDAQLARVVAGDAWIVEGNFEHTLEPRLRRADTVIVLDFPVLLSLRRVLRRRLSGGSRIDLADGCRERLNLQPLRQAISYRRRTRAAIAEAVRRHAADARVVVLRRPAEVEALLAGLADARRPTAAAAPASLSVVVPARDAERTLPAVLAALARELAPGDETIVVDDGSTDATAAVARDGGARVVASGSGGSAGAARNAGWREARGDVVVFLDADAVVRPGWYDGLQRSLAEHPGALVGCARVPVGSNGWSWAAQLQVATPWLPRGAPRPARALPAFCLAVPREAPIRWDERFGGEDGVFAVDALEAGYGLVFDPRFAAVHDEHRVTFADVRSWHRRLAYGMARCGEVQREGLRKRLFTRVPLHYFLLARLPILYRRTDADPALRACFLRTLPWLVAAEWSLGLAALRYVVRRPPLRAEAPPAAAPATPVRG